MFHAGSRSVCRDRDYRETFAYDKAKYATFVVRMQEEAIRLIGRGLWYVSAAHTEADIEQCVATAHEVLQMRWGQPGPARATRKARCQSGYGIILKA